MKAGRIAVTGRTSFILDRAYDRASRARESSASRATCAVVWCLLLFVGGSVLLVVRHHEGLQGLQYASHGGSGDLPRRAGAGSEGVLSGVFAGRARAESVSSLE
jgi:hypothetical protein